MEALYTVLQDEIHSFKAHMRSCQQAFDIHTLCNVLLLLLPEDGSGKDIQSLEQLEKLVETREWDGQEVVKITTDNKSSDIPSYISWFISYVRYLGSLKEAFDTKVVFPLCEKLYINDDRLPLSMVPFGGRRGHAAASVAHIAKQLFAMRRKWALLLKGGRIDDQVFSSQSLFDLQGFANFHPFVKIVRLVPDLFHKSLVSAELARQWVELHASRHSPQPAGSDPSSIRKSYDTGLVAGSSKRQSGWSQYQHDYGGGWPQCKASSTRCRDACTRGTIQERNKLDKVHGQLRSLLQREERSWILEAEIRKVKQRMSSLHTQREDKERELEALEHQLEKDSRRTAVTQHQTVFHELDALGRQLRLEEYREHILQGDWLLELEVRPALLRQINTVRGWGNKLLSPIVGIVLLAQVTLPCCKKLGVLRLVRMEGA